jgi:hypothetical protein
MRSVPLNYVSVKMLLNERPSAAGAGRQCPRVRQQVLAQCVADLRTPRPVFFTNAGRRFHGNDARGVAATLDSPGPVPALVSSTEAELGLRTESIPSLQSSLHHDRCAL